MDLSTYMLDQKIIFFNNCGLFLFSIPSNDGSAIGLPKYSLIFVFLQILSTVSIDKFDIQLDYQESEIPDNVARAASLSYERSY